MNNWQENDHPRANDGKFTNKDTPAEIKRYNELYGEKDIKNKKIEQLVDVLKKGKDKNVGQLLDVLTRVKKVRLKEIHNYIKTLNPIKLTMNGNEIIAEFTRETANKNIYTKGGSNTEGQHFKLENYRDIPHIVETSSYDHTQKEKGKKSPLHSKTKQWHYFKNQVQKENGNYDITVNIGETKNKNIVYEIKIKKI